MSEPDHLYFVAEPEEPDGSRWVKIGRAKNVARRLFNLRCGTPRPLEVIGIAVGKGNQERAAHKALAHLRGNGEWFLLSRDQWEGLRDRLAREFPEWMALLVDHREKERERRKDPGFREKEREHMRKRRAEDPEFREKERERDRKRYAENPEVREKKRERDRKRRAHKKS